MATIPADSERDESSHSDLRSPPADPLRPRKRKVTDARFVVSQHRQASGVITYRVRGFTRTGDRIREQYRSAEAARARANELESQWIGKDLGAAMRLTRLSPRELGLAESAFVRLPEPGDLKLAVDFWLKFGRQHKGEGDVPDLEAAATSFYEWLASEECDLRPKTRYGYRKFIEQFVDEAGALDLASLNPDVIEATLKQRWPAQPTSRHNVRIALSRFCSWCMQRPRRWLASNPASGRLIETKPAHVSRQSEPEVFTLKQVMRLLAAARRMGEGRFLRYIVLSLFAGLRPTEALRVRADQPKLDEGELRIEATQAKTGRSRMVHLPAVAVAWLKICPFGVATDGSKNRLLWEEFKRKAKIKYWPHDGLRHTALSHYFRAKGSYGLTAEWAGNSESIIKDHYQGRVSCAESDRFWNLYPDRNQRRAMRKQIAKASKRVRESGNPAGRFV